MLEDQDGCRRRQGRWPVGQVRGRRRPGGRGRALRHDPAVRRPRAERQEDRRREGRRHRHRPRLHPVDAQMRTNVPHIFAIGDIVGQPMLAHKAVHGAHVAAEVAAGHKAAFDATVIPGVAYTHPRWRGSATPKSRRKEGEGRDRQVPVGCFRPRHRQRRRLRLYQADLRRRDAPASSAAPSSAPRPAT